MAQVFTAFGIDWRLLVINSINFGLLMLALWYFLYGPLLRILDERKKKVAQGVIDAEEAGRKLSEIEDSRKDILAGAGKEADGILIHARENASHKEHEIIAAGESAAARIVEEAQRQAQELKHQALAESKQETAKLIVLGMEKLMRQK